MATKIKICGLRTKQDIMVANELLLDYIGFVFAKSKRMVTDKEARELKKQLKKEIKAVGVFVDDSVEHIASLCEQNIIDVVQLHGSESEEYVKSLREKVRVPVIRAIRVQWEESIKRYATMDADYILFDSFLKEGVFGGTGEQLKLSYLPTLTRPTFLAGGMNESNIESIIKEFHPYAIDVSSSVETEGKKDPEKMRRIVRIVRKVGNQNE